MKKYIATQAKTQEESALAQTQQGERVFENVEDLLRLDSSQHPVPPSVGAKLEQSVRLLPPPPPKGGTWWSRLFGG